MNNIFRYTPTHRPPPPPVTMAPRKVISINTRTVTDVDMPTMVGHRRFARITRIPPVDNQPRYLLRLVDGSNDIVWRSHNTGTLIAFADRYFGKSLRWNRTDDGTLWVAP